MQQPGALRFHHVDVFSPRPCSGNSLTVFLEARDLTAGQRLALTREMRHFESAFLAPGDDDRSWRARVFDLVEEMDFAGHPLIGAACVLHAEVGVEETETWRLKLNHRVVTVRTRRRAGGGYAAVLDQGAPAFLATPEPAVWRDIAGWLSLRLNDLHPVLRPQVVTTGLRYLVVPVAGSEALARARIATADLEHGLAKLGAQYVYLLDAESREGRHWTNDGSLEDVATGSGAGCAAAYLRRHERIGDGEAAVLRQGRFVGRPSEIDICVHGPSDAIRSVEVGGDVAMVSEGWLTGLPP